MQGKRKKELKQSLTAASFLAPSLLGLILFSAVPVVFSMFISLTDWNYVNGILKVWKNEGVRTLGDVQSRDERRKPPAGQQPKRSAAEDYDFIFGGSNDS